MPNNLLGKLITLTCHKTVGMFDNLCEEGTFVSYDPLKAKVLLLSLPKSDRKKLISRNPCLRQFCLSLLDGKYYNLRNFMVSGAKVEMKFWILSVAFILAEIIHLAESQCRRCDQSITGKEIIYIIY